MVLPLVVLPMRERPAHVGVLPYGAEVADPPSVRGGNPFRAAASGLRLGASSRNFWLLAATFFVCGASTNGLVGTHLIPAAR